MKKEKTLKSGIYFNEQYGYYLYDAQDGRLVSLIDDGEEPVGLTTNGYEQNIPLTYVAKDIMELFSILQRYKEQALPAHVTWGLKHMTS
jgi:hypothetical protein